MKTKMLSKDYILDVAESVFAENGIKDATLAEIAKKAKISKGTLYYYYSAKKDLVLDVTERHLNTISENIKAFCGTIKDKASISISLKNLFSRIFSLSNYNKIHISILNEAATNVELKEKLKLKNKEWFLGLETTLNTYSEDNRVKCSGVASIILSVINASSTQTTKNLEDISLTISTIL